MRHVAQLFRRQDRVRRHGRARGLLVSEDAGASFRALDKDLSDKSISSIVFSPTFAERRDAVGLCGS